jgi:hypothetical protein
MLYSGAYSATSKKKKGGMRGGVVIDLGLRNLVAKPGVLRFF